MKRTYVITLILICFSIASYAQNSLFDKYADMNGVTSVYISKAMLNMIPNMKTNGVNISGVASKLDNIQIIHAERADIIARLKGEQRHITPQNGYEELMRVNDEGNKVTIYLKTEKNGKKEFILFNDQDKELTIILIRGNVTLNEIQNIVKK